MYLVPRYIKFFFCHLEHLIGNSPFGGPRYKLLTMVFDH